VSRQIWFLAFAETVALIVIGIDQGTKFWLPVA
jgi:hypothetical protein